MEKTGVAIVGMGTVGAGVARLLYDHGDRIARHAGRQLWLTHAVVRDLNKPRDVDLPANVVTDEVQKVIADKNVKVVAQLIGGIEPARTIMLKLLESGKDVVTANKALMAQHGPELFDRARELGRVIAFEASVAGGIPIIANISQCLSANQIVSLQGILNGTSNYIITRMDLEGASYNQAVKEAQDLGYAEADPSMDVDGTDAVQKLAILSHLAFGARPDWTQIPKRGIDTLDDADLRYARQLGFRVKLIAYSKLVNGKLQLMVGPMLINIGTPLAEVRANYNAVSVIGDAVGPVFFHGQGAGQMPTASAVVADMIDMAVGRTKITFETLELWAEGQTRVDVGDPGELEGKFYLRFDVQDEPNVLAQIAGVLGKHKISIASVYQHDGDSIDKGIVPLVIVTHLSAEKNASSAVEELAKLDCVAKVAERLRILD